MHRRRNLSFRGPGKAPPRTCWGHAGHTNIVAALRSKPEGVAALRPSFCLDLLPSRLVRCRDAPGVTADVAILTLENPFSLLATPLHWVRLPGAASLK